MAKNYMKNLKEETKSVKAENGYVENFNTHMDWAMPFQRTTAFPLDRSSIFDSLDDAIAYAKGDGSDKRKLGKTSYAGQIISVYENSEVKVYKINSDNTLSQLSAASDSQVELDTIKTNLTSEIEARKAVDGQTGQTYVANTTYSEESQTGVHYIGGATSLNDADIKLDAAIKAEETSRKGEINRVEGLVSTETTNRGKAITDLIDDADTEYNTLGKLEDRIIEVNNVANSSKTTVVAGEGKENHLTVTPSSESGPKTYTINLLDIASERSFNTLSGNVDTMNEILTAHTGNEDIHVTLEDKKKWNQVISDLAIEVTNRGIKDTNLSEAITGEIDRAENAESDLLQKITSNKVSSSGKTITVTEITTGETKGTNIDVNVDGTSIVVGENGVLSVADSALTQYSGSNSINVSDAVNSVKTILLKLDPQEKILSEGAGGLFSTLKLSWDSSKGLKLLGLNDEQIGDLIPATDFIKDGMLDNVTLIEPTKEDPKTYLLFEFNTSTSNPDGTSPKKIKLDVTKLVDIYTSGNGITISEDKKVSINKATGGENYLVVDENGIKVTGITTAISNAQTSATTEITTTDTGHIRVSLDEKSGHKVYTISANDIASANELAGVKTTANNAATKTELTEHITNQVSHITSEERTKWNKIGTSGETSNESGSAFAQIGYLKDSLANKANNSDLTAHTGNTDIHVTTSDKAKWNTTSEGLKTEITNRANQDDKIEASVGLATDGSHVKTNGKYTSGASTVVGEIAALDAQVFTNTGAIATEKQRAEKKEGELETKINDEIAAREALSGSGNIQVTNDSSTPKRQTISLVWGTF